MLKRLTLPATIFLIGFALCAPAYAHSFTKYPSGFDYSYWQIRFNAKKSRCLHRIAASGDSYDLKISDCRGTRDQMWFMTTRGEIRNVKRPNHCITRKSGGRAKLEPCGMSQGISTNVPANQYWETGRKRIVQGSVCLTSQDKTNGAKVTIERCRDNRASKKKWVTKHLNNRLRAKHLVGLGIHDFAMCWSLSSHGSKGQGYHFADEDDEDQINANKNNCITNAYKKKIDWGYRYGTGQPSIIQNKGKLDFGERYSVERCSKAHDEHWVKVEHENFIKAASRLANRDKAGFKAELDWVHFINCLKRVRPSNEDEERARDSGITFTKFLANKRGPVNGKDASDDWGELDTVPSGNLTKDAHKTTIERANGPTFDIRNPFAGLEQFGQ